ncbi:unnamed protein product [Cladocopium goreaui]|uniref:Low-density lipoprotein receptor-related protein 1 (LRP-1) (Alpha-2-macroglobulin receptor) (A2MR) n=1 Tax=Cladocopium goreaui TaxID=2562237 RepID=A0A9P1BGL7_9DINO|nr:unnamed protein product [Cladocopium goreaui]
MEPTPRGREAVRRATIGTGSRYFPALRMYFAAYDRSSRPDYPPQTESGPRNLKTRRANEAKTRFYQIRAITYCVVTLLFSQSVVFSAQIYWTETAERIGGTQAVIRRSNLDGSNVTDVVTTGLDSPRQIAIDSSTGMMYWADSDTIRRANLDGSGIVDLIAGEDGAYGIALDVQSGKIYWTNFEGNEIRRADLDGNNSETLLDTGSMGPTGIALDTVNREIYFTSNTNNFAVRRLDFDGLNPVEVVTTQIRGSGGIALDVSDSKMYYTSYNEDISRRADLDGANVEDLYTGLVSPMDVALDIPAGMMYWVDFDAGNNGAVLRAPMDGNGPTELLFEGANNPLGITIHVPEPSTATMLAIGVALVFTRAFFARRM